jgi:hypothetical protein
LEGEVVVEMQTLILIVLVGMWNIFPSSADSPPPWYKSGIPWWFHGKLDDDFKGDLAQPLPPLVDVQDNTKPGEYM